MMAEHLPTIEAAEQVVRNEEAWLKAMLARRLERLSVAHSQIEKQVQAVLMKEYERQTAQNVPDEEEKRIDFWEMRHLKSKP